MVTMPVCDTLGGLQCRCSGAFVYQAGVSNDLILGWPFLVVYHLMRGPLESCIIPRDCVQIDISQFRADRTQLQQQHMSCEQGQCCALRDRSPGCSISAAAPPKSFPAWTLELARQPLSLSSVTAGGVSGGTEGATLMVTGWVASYVDSDTEYPDGGEGQCSCNNRLLGFPIYFGASCLTMLSLVSFSLLHLCVPLGSGLVPSGDPRAQGLQVSPHQKFLSTCQASFARKRGCVQAGRTDAWHTPARPKMRALQQWGASPCPCSQGALLTQNSRGLAASPKPQTQNLQCLPNSSCSSFFCLLLCTILMSLYFLDLTLVGNTSRLTPKS